MRPAEFSRGSKPKPSKFPGGLFLSCRKTVVFRQGAPRTQNCHFQKTTAPVHGASRLACSRLLNWPCQQSYARDAAIGQNCSEVSCTMLHTGTPDYAEHRIFGGSGLSGFVVPLRRYGDPCAALSVKRSLAGHAGHLSDNYLINGLSDIKIDGRNDGQKGGNGVNRLCAGIHGNSARRFTERRFAQSGLRTGI